MVAQDQRVFPKGQPALHDQGHAAMLTCLRHVEETLVLVPGPGAGSSLSLRNANNRHVPHRLGSGHEWPLSPWVCGAAAISCGTSLPGDAGCVSCVETLSSSGPKRPPCVGAHREHSGGFLHQPPGRSAFAPPLQAGAPDPCVGPR